MPFLDKDQWLLEPHKDDVTPGRRIPVVYSDHIQLTLWGWWFWKTGVSGKRVKNLVINTRDDTLRSKLAGHDRKYEEVFHQHRVLVPAHGFYEWPRKIKTKFNINNGKMFALAGLIFPSEDQQGQVVDCVSIITVPASKQMSQYHDRMPLVIPEHLYGDWLGRSSSSSVEDLEHYLTSEEVSFGVRIAD